MSIEQTLAQFAHAPVRAEAALAMMRLSLLDWAACGLAGLAEPLASLLRAKALDEGGAPQATLFGGGRVPARAAALVNGAVSHALDYDDTHFAHIGHPSVAVIPAALAIAERTGADLATLVEAALVGVEGSIRVGLWLGRDHYEVGFHQTATAGAFGATLAAARSLGLTVDQTRAALGLCATRASGLKAQFGSMGKPYNAGIAAETGVESALLAQAGMTAPITGLSHPQGFGPTHHGQADEDALTGLGTLWRFETVSHKFHACCHGLHAMIEATRSLSPDPRNVAAVTIHTHPRWLSVCNKAAPQTGLEAKFSYRFTCAMVLAGVDTAMIGNYSDALTQRGDLTLLRDRVMVVADQSLSELQARVTITGLDGATRLGEYDLDAPLALDQRTDKLRGKARALVGDGPAQALWDAICADDLAGLVGRLGAAPRG